MPTPHSNLLPPTCPLAMHPLSKIPTHVEDVGVPLHARAKGVLALGQAVEYHQAQGEDVHRQRLPRRLPVSGSQLLRGLPPRAATCVGVGIADHDRAKEWAGACECELLGGASGWQGMCGACLEEQGRLLDVPAWMQSAPIHHPLDVEQGPDRGGKDLNPVNQATLKARESEDTRGDLQQCSLRTGPIQACWPKPCTLPPLLLSSHLSPASRS